MLKEDGIELSEDSYILNSLTKACRYHNDHVRVKLPIRRDLLNALLKQINVTFLECENPQPYLAKLYRAMFATSYYGLLCIREVADGDHPILARDVFIGVNKDKLKFILRTSKTHWLDVEPQIVKISRISTQRTSKDIDECCPYNILWEYLQARPEYKDDDENFFVFKDRTPVKPYTITKILKETLTACNFDARYYSMHGMRSGRSVDLLSMGVSVETIKKLGRWKSNAVFRYLKQ